MTGSVIAAYQILTCLSYALILYAFGFYIQWFLEPQLKKALPFVNILLLMLLSFQLPLHRLTFEFVKNGFAIALFLMASTHLLKKNLKRALIIGLLAALTHKTVALFFLATLTGSLFSKSNHKKKMAVIATAFTGLAIILNPRLVNHFTNFLGNIRFEKFSSLITYNLHLTGWHVLLVFFWLVTALTQFFKMKKNLILNLEQKLFLFVLFLAAIIPLLPIYGGVNAEIKWRLMIFSFCFAFLLFIVALSFIKNKKVLFANLLLTLILLAHQLLEPSGFPWIVATSTQVPQVQRLLEFVKSGEELITHHGMEFYVDFKTPIRAKSLLTPGALPKYQLAYIPEFFLLNDDAADAIEQVKLLDIGPTYGLFYYEDFQKLIKEFPIMNHWKNTFRVRPDFIQSYN